MKKLHRDRAEGKVSGLCAGLAEYAEVDVTFIRIIALILILMSGVVPGVVFYFIAALITPIKGQTDAKA